MFTRNLCPGAPVTWCREVLPGGLARGLVVNAGNANVFTGVAGMRAVEATAKAAAATLGAGPGEIFLASTGVIGETLPAEKIVAVMDGLKADLQADRFAEAAAAIMTTDTFPKGATRTAKLGGVEVRINGIAKGSGMIAPDMATMLSFIFTDAAIPAPALQAMLGKGVDSTLQLRDHQFRHLDLGHGAALRHRCGGQQADRGPWRAGGFPPRPARGAA